MKKRTVSLTTYPCGAVVLEVTTVQLPAIVPTNVTEPDREPAPA